MVITAIGKINNGYTDDAANILTNTVLSRVDGCVLRGQPDDNGLGSGIKKDWILNCALQTEIYYPLEETISLLQ